MFGNALHVQCAPCAAAAAAAHHRFVADFIHQNFFSLAVGMARVRGRIHSNEYSLYSWIALPTRSGMNVLTVAHSIAMTLQYETENDIAISCQRHRASHQLKRPFSFHLPQLFSPFTQ